MKKIRKSNNRLGADTAQETALVSERLENGQSDQAVDETFLYRHFDENGCLLYIGISLNVVGRLSQHREHSGWYRQIRSVSVESFPTRQDAVAAERAAIKMERPKFNVIHNKETEKPTGVGDGTRLEMLRRVFVHPAYKIKDVAEEIGMTKGQVLRLIDDGHLGCVYQGSRRYVTGWQLIAFLEWWDSVGTIPPAKYKISGIQDDEGTGCPAFKPREGE